MHKVKRIKTTGKQCFCDHLVSLGAQKNLAEEQLMDAMEFPRDLFFSACQMKYALQNRMDNLHLLILNLVFQVYFVQSKSIGSLLKRNETGAILGIFSKISFHTKRKVLEDISEKEKSTTQPL